MSIGFAYVWFYKGLTFESMDEILWCDHSNESSLPVISHDVINFLFLKMNFRKWNLELWSKFAFGHAFGSERVNPLSPNIHKNSPNWSLYISLKNELREFNKRSKHFLLGDHFINSYNLISWRCMDIVRKKLIVGHYWDLTG